MDIKAKLHEIEDTNISILNFLNHRTSIIKEILEHDDSLDFKLYSPKIEADMMETILKNNKGPLQHENIREMFNEIFSLSNKSLGIVCKKDLLISSKSSEEFCGIQNMFGLENGEPVIIAGPCAIEKAEYLNATAEFIKQKGLRFIRGGAFKPRSSPYDFQGLRKEGLRILRDVGDHYGLYTITEVVDTRDVELVSQYVDILQIGARNMHNYELLKEVGRTKRPILLKRGISATLEEFMYAAEYIVLEGNKKVIMCERGIRTYETMTRNTLDISAIPIIKNETKLPIFVDLSHSLGRKDIINSIACAAISAGADGIMLEVHPYPELALSDRKQQLNMLEFENLLSFLKQRKLLFRGQNDRATP